MGFNSALVPMVNDAAAKYCGDPATYRPIGGGEYTAVDIICDILSGVMVGADGPQEALPQAQIPEGQTPKPRDGDEFDLLGVTYRVDGVANDNGMWLLDVRVI